MRPIEQANHWSGDQFATCGRHPTLRIAPGHVATAARYGEGGTRREPTGGPYRTFPVPPVAQVDPDATPRSQPRLRPFVT